jgi:glycosyltransferase involved in cell wall biosynthesis
MKIVFSGVNLVSGGTLSVFKDVLSELSRYFSNDENFVIYAIVHDKKDFENLSNIRFIEFPKAKKSYMHRLFHEYWKFNLFAQKNNIDIWISMHDITPRLKNVKQFVYCHNPAPLDSIKLRTLWYEPKHFLFTLFYGILYGINIKKNHKVIVQQNWLREHFAHRYNLDLKKIIVAHPEVVIPNVSQNIKVDDNHFFYPTFSRPFKNIELICEVFMQLWARGHKVKLTVTIDGTENNYSKRIYNKFKHCENIYFVGRVSRDDVYEYYQKCTGLVFPSQLETWGMPLSEFKYFEKVMFVANEKYAFETLSGAKKVILCETTNIKSWISNIELYLKGKVSFTIIEPISIDSPYASNWKDLVKLILEV